MTTKGQSTKESIKKAALKLFVEKGTKGSSIRDISSAVGITEGAFYRHYTSKDELIQDLFLTPYFQAADQIKALASDQSDFTTQLSNIIGYWCQRIDEDPLLFQYMLMTQHNLLQLVKKQDTTPFAVMEAFFQKAIDAKQTKIQDATFLTTLFMGIFVQGLGARVRGLTKKTMKEDQGIIIQLFKDGVMN